MYKPGYFNFIIIMKLLLEGKEKSDKSKPIPVYRNKMEHKVAHSKINVKTQLNILPSSMEV